MPRLFVYRVYHTYRTPWNTPSSLQQRFKIIFDGHSRQLHDPIRFSHGESHNWGHPSDA
jgi:hypothetical protein